MRRHQKKLHGVCLVIPIIMLVCFTSPAQTSSLSAVDREAAFKTAGFQFINKQWINDCYDPEMPSSEPGDIEVVQDLNGDGSLEAVITDGGTSCHGNTGVGFSIVSKRANGSWILIFTATGIYNFLETKGMNGWPDIEIGGPGFCSGVWQWNGTKYEYKCSREATPGGCSRRGINNICK